MIEFFYDYGLFLAKILTIVLALAALISIIAHNIRQHSFSDPGPRIKVKNLNDRYDAIERQLNSNMMEDDEWKRFIKQEKKDEKAKRKARKKGKTPEKRKKKLFVLDFEGDLMATDVAALREEITAILIVADKEDEVLVRLESGGGVIFGYGLGASQLQRLRDHGIHLTVSVDKIAASGGYKMACVADKLVAAPFAMLGSIGVAAEIPNIHRLLKKFDIDYEQITAGEYKRTLTLFGENTAKARNKVIQELGEAHELFKTHIAEHRPKLDIQKVATGETWFGKQAMALNLVDELITSDDHLLAMRKEADLIKIQYREPVPWQERFAMPFANLLQKSILRMGSLMDRSWLRA